jgi:hypothetical protein
MKRYENDLTIKNGKLLQTNSSITIIRNAISRGLVSYREITLKEGERLDTLAGKYYGDGSLWWILAAASNIGWWLQVPPGTIIKIPTDLGVISSLL